MDFEFTPSSPKEGERQRKNPRNHRAFRYQNSQTKKSGCNESDSSQKSTRSVERKRIENRNLNTPRSRTFYSEIKNFIDTELLYARNDADRIYVYKRAFDTLLQEFQICRPVLASIKKNYDEYSTSLLHQKRNIIIDSDTTTLTEDTYDEIVNNMRRVENREFQKCEKATEELLDQMTQLRVQKSELNNKVELVTKRRQELKSVISSQQDTICKANTDTLLLIDDIKTKKSQNAFLERTIEKLEEKLSETQLSSDQLISRDNLLTQKLDDCISEEEASKKALDAIMAEQAEIDEQLAQIETINWELTRRNNILEPKYMELSQRKERTDSAIRETLAPFHKNPNRPILDILKQLSRENNFEL